MKWASIRKRRVQRNRARLYMARKGALELRLPRRHTVAGPQSRPGFGFVRGDSLESGFLGIGETSTSRV